MENGGAVPRMRVWEHCGTTETHLVEELGGPGSVFCSDLGAVLGPNWVPGAPMFVILESKILQNPLLEPSWGLLEPSWGSLGGLLGACWAHLEKNLKKPTLFGPNLGAKIQQKLPKKQCNKWTCFEIRFLIEFSSILHRFWILSTINFRPNLAIKWKTSIL